MPAGIWKSKWVRRLLAVFGILSLIQVGAYVMYARRIMPQTCLRQLRDYKLIRDMDFVIIEPDTWSALSPAERENLSAEVRRYVPTIYRSLKEVPQGALHYEPLTENQRQGYQSALTQGYDPKYLEPLREELESGRRLAWIERGMRIACGRDESGLFWMKAHTDVWMSLTGAETVWYKYIWVLGFWMPIGSPQGAMA